MEDIARQAGVAKSTVSMALRNDPSLPKVTCERIQSIAKEMGYRPNPLVSALMTNVRSNKTSRKKMTLAFVSAFPVEETARTVPTFRRYLQGIADQTKQLGYALDVFSLRDPGITARSLSRIMQVRGIPGFVLSPLPAPTFALDMDWESLKCVALGHTLVRPISHKVCHNQYHGMKLALEHLQELGYRKIGLAMDSILDQRTEHNYLAGILVRQFPSRSPRFPVFISDDWTEMDFARWFKKNRPEVVITVFPEVKDWLKNLGLRIPEDVGFAVLDWSAEMTGCAGIDQKSELVGSAAVDLLVEQIYKNKHGIPETPKLVSIEGKWVAGETVIAQVKKKAPLKAMA